MRRKSKLDASFKAKVAIEALKEKDTLQALAKKYEVSPNTISNWVDELVSNSSKAFEPDSADKKEIKKLKESSAKLERKVGQLTIERDFFAEACETAGLKIRK